jgi:hypothetical protein
MTIPSIQAQSKAAKLSAKKSKAARLFNAQRQYSAGLLQRIGFHTNGNLNEPFRKIDLFLEHNNAKELCDIGLLSETAIFLEEMDGRPRNVAHLWSLARAASYSGGKVNNVSNLIVLLRETNQLINKRCISRAHAEVLDRMVYSGNYLAARVFANQVCF